MIIVVFEGPFLNIQHHTCVLGRGGLSKAPSTGEHLSILSPSSNPGHLLSPPAFCPNYPIGVTEQAPVAAGLSYSPKPAPQQFLLHHMSMTMTSCHQITCKCRCSALCTIKMPWHGNLDNRLPKCRGEQGQPKSPAHPKRHIVVVSHAGSLSHWGCY